MKNLWKSFFLLLIGNMFNLSSAQEDTCMPHVQLTRCNTKFENIASWRWRRDRTYTIYSTVKRGCDDSTLEFKWSLIDRTRNSIKRYSPSKNKWSFTIEYFELDIGDYTLKLTVNEFKKGSKQGTSSSECLITIVPQLPFSRIFGGTYREIDSGKSFKMDGKLSTNKDVRPGTATKLYYRWFCTSNNEKDFCKPDKPISNNKGITIPASKAIDGFKYDFELKVSTDKTNWVSSKQRVVIRKGAANLYVICLKNCGPKVNYHSTIFWQMKCDNCLQGRFEWTQDKIKGHQFIWYDAAFFWNTSKLFIKRHALDNDKFPNWTFTGNYTGIDGRTGRAELEINVAFISEPECTWKTFDGKVVDKITYSIDTTYSAICTDHYREPVTYKMYTGGFVSRYLVAASEEGKFVDVRLADNGPQDSHLKHCIRVIDADGIYREKNYTVDVHSAIWNYRFNSNNQINLFMNVYEGKLEPFGSIKSVLASGDFEHALQMLYALNLEVLHIKEKEENFINITTNAGKFRSKWQWTVFELLKKIPIDSIDRLNQVTSLLYAAEYIIKDRIFRMQATDMVKIILKKYKKMIQNAPYPDALDCDVEQQTDISLVFSLTCTRPSPEDIIHEWFGYNSFNSSFNFTTPKYFLDLPVVMENYPNYDDADLQYAMKLRDYQDLCETTMELFTLTSFLILQLMVPGGACVEQGVKVINDDTFLPESKTRSYVLICLNDAKAFPEGEFGAFNAFVNAQASVKRWRGPIALVVVAFEDRKAFLWWQEKILSTPVVNVNFFKNSKRIEKLPEPMTLRFTDVSDPTDTFTATRASVTVPKDSDKWEAQYLDYNMTVHRVRIKRGGMLNIRFKDILTTKGNDELKVVVTYNRRPHWKDFDESILVTNKNNNKSIRSVFPNALLKYGDTFAYVAVLPTNEKTEKGSDKLKSANYSVRFAVINCLLWNPSSLKWISKFCSVLLFLSDNVQSERYAYLVVIKTGNKDDAGTTSNVGMKIFGNKRDSMACELNEDTTYFCFSWQDLTRNFNDRPVLNEKTKNSMAHLLNYPDPSKKLLQRDEEDWFVLTAEKHLGIIQRIHVWHDSVGQRPSWYCDWLTITDLQTLDEWYFNVKTWLSVTREEHCKLILEPSDPDAKKSRYNKKFLERIKKNHTWDICSKEGLSYIQHITVMLSIVLTTYSFTLMFYGIPKMQLYDGLGHGHFEITKTTIYITLESSILSFCLNTVFVVLLKMSKKGSTSKLYRFITKLAWILMIFTILACFTFLVVCSFWIPIVTSLLWLFSTSGALIQIIFLLENAYLIITTLLQKIERVTVPRVTRVALVKDIERQREKLYSTFGEVLFRPYFKDKYRPLTREEWKMKRQKELARLKISDLMKDLIVFVIYIVLLYYVTLANRDAYDVYGDKEMKNIVYGLHTRTMNFKDIQNRHDFETYVNQTLIPNLFAMHWYGNSNLKSPGLLSDFNTKIINVARFRQLRVCKHCCKIPVIMKGLNLTCALEFSWLYNDKGVYQEFWKDKKHQVVPRLIDAWKYQYDAISFVGDVAVYPSGGYSAPLGRTVYNTFYDLRYYQRAHWIDRRTSVIFIEFLAYNRNYNLFHAVTLMVEHSVSGLFINTAKIYTTRLLYLDGKLQRTVTFVFILFVIITFVVFLRNLNAARKSLKAYFKNAWNILDVVIILMSFSFIVLYIHRATVIGELLHRLQKKHNQMISYFDIIHADEMFKVLAAILVCVATVRLCKLLTFGTKFKIMERMAKLLNKYLFSVFIFHMIILLMYSLTGNLLFGSYFKEFRNISVSMTTLILLSLNLASKFDYERFEDATFGYTFYVSYVLVTVIIFTLYIVVIILAYEESSGSYSNNRQYYSFTRYMFDEFHYIKGLIKKGINYVRLSAGADDNTTRKKVTPKADKYRYADAVTLSAEKLYTMDLIALSVIKNYLNEKKEEETVSEEDLTLMTQTVYHILKPADEEDVPKHDFVAFATNDKDGKRVLIKDETLLKMEYIANYLADKTTAMDSKAVLLAGQEQRVFDKTTIQGRLEYLQHILQGLSDVFDNIKVVYE